MPKAPLNLNQLEALVEIVQALRGPEGCPWDKEQTHMSLTHYAIEETFELVEAIEKPVPQQEKDQLIKEELGDVLFQVLLHTQLASERGAFSLQDVIHSISEKLVRRHPHVFAGEKVSNSQEVIANWEVIKRQEKIAQGHTSKYRLNVPPLPALQRSHKIGKRTEKLKFDWDNISGVMDKVEEEYQELREAIVFGNKHDIEHEIGDALFSIAQLSRHLDLEPEQVLRKANYRFENRFNKMIELCELEKKEFDQIDINEKEAFWQLAKKILKNKEGEY